MNYPEAELRGILLIKTGHVVFAKGELI